MNALLFKAVGSFTASVSAVVGMLAVEISSLPGVALTTLAILAAIAAFAGTIFGVKYRSAADSERRAREAAQALVEIQTERVAVEQARGEEMLRRLDQTRETLEETRVALVDAQKTIARLEALPNLERVLELVGGTFQKLAEDMHEIADRNDSKNAERHRTLLGALAELKGQAA